MASNCKTNETEVNWFNIRVQRADGNIKKRNVDITSNKRTAIPIYRLSSKWFKSATILFLPLQSNDNKNIIQNAGRLKRGIVMLRGIESKIDEWKSFSFFLSFFLSFLRQQEKKKEEEEEEQEEQEEEKFLWDDFIDL